MKPIFYLLLLLLPSCTLAQSFEWAFGMGNSASDFANAITLDDAGNAYTTGSFAGTVDFDPSTANFDLVSSGPADIFVQKIDAAGNLLWAKQIEVSDGGHGEAICVDPSGHIYITGGFKGTADFDPGTASLSYSSMGSVANSFVLKLDTDGNLVWATYAASPGVSVGRAIAVNAAGNIYTTGNFEFATNFDPGGAAILTASGVRDTYIQKHDALGNLLWVKQIENTVVNEGKSLAVDATGDVYLTGKFWGTADFDPSTGVMELTAVGADDTYILKLETSGNFAWVKQIGGNGYEYGYAIKLDAYGNIYTTGSFQESVDFDPGMSTTTLTATGGDDIYILKLTSAGDFVWVRQMGGSGYDLGTSLTLDIAGNIYTTGSFENTVDFDPGTGVVNLISSGSADIFVQKLDASGNLVYVHQIGATGLDFGFGIEVDNLQNVYATGMFHNTVDFDPGVGSTPIAAAGLSDIFVFKFANGYAVSNEPQFETPSLRLYPNPTTDRLVIESELSEIPSFSLFNMMGQDLSHFVEIIHSESRKLIVDISPLPSAMYLLQTKDKSYRLYKE